MAEWTPPSAAGTRSALTDTHFRNPTVAEVIVLLGERRFVVPRGLPGAGKARMAWRIAASGPYDGRGRTPSRRHLRGLRRRHVAPRRSRKRRAGNQHPKGREERNCHETQDGVQRRGDVHQDPLQVVSAVAGCACQTQPSAVRAAPTRLAPVAHGCFPLPGGGIGPTPCPQQKRLGRTHSAKTFPRDGPSVGKLDWSRQDFVAPPGFHDTKQGAARGSVPCPSASTRSLPA